MTIIHVIDEFLCELFPRFKDSGYNTDVLYEEVMRFYTFGNNKPTVNIASNDKIVTIEIDTSIITPDSPEFLKVTRLCEQGKYDIAKPILHSLIKYNPTNSEYHRVMGQIHSDQGEQDAAIDSLIEALRWNPKNGWALIMMGNIFGKFKDDIETAKIYFDQAVISNPEDNIAVNNIGATLMQQGRLDEAKEYFRRAMEIDPSYPNTHFALGMVALMQGDLDSSFEYTIQSIKLNKVRDPLFQNAVKQVFDISKKIAKLDKGHDAVFQYKKKLEDEGGVGIEMMEDADIPTAAKFELADNYKRDVHMIRFKPNYPAVEHLIFHELVHLEFMHEARRAGENQLFVSNQQKRNLFITNLGTQGRKLKKMGYPEDAIEKYFSELFDGMNRQVYNTPIDLFIEQKIYDDNPVIRPFQFLSMYNGVMEAIKAVTEKKIVELSPKDILSKSKIYNIINFLQFRDLYGIDLINELNATQSELKEAKEMYNEYLQYRGDRQPGEEYELVKHWAEDLKLNGYFDLIDEVEYREKVTRPEKIIEDIEKDPWGIESEDPIKRKEMETFLEQQKKTGTNMAVAMFMVGALNHFKDMPKNQIKDIAYEIALQGTQGYNPQKKDYRISKMPGKLFSGYQILAYYYVSWKLAIPEMVEQLQLPYDDEYELALTMHKNEY